MKWPHGNHYFLLYSAGSWISYYSFLAAAQRRKELEAWAIAKELRFSADNNYSFDHRLPEFKYLQQGSNRYAYNIIQGHWQERSFLGFDYHYETYSTDSKGNRQTYHYYFSAIILSSKVPLKPLFIRPESFLDKITEFFGYDDIDFESAEFSRKFYVKAADRRWAYDVIHTRTMEFLLSAPLFTIQFDSTQVMAYRSGTFSTQDFEAATEVVRGILDRLPEYLVRQQEGKV